MKHLIKIMRYILVLSLIVLISGCGNVETQQSQSSNQMNETSKKENQSRKKIKISIGNKDFIATLENNDAVNELVEMLEESSLTLDLTDYSGFEKVGPLGKTLTTSDTQMTTQSGDIVLYNGNQIVLFYGSNNWSYTKLAHVDDINGWSDTLGSGDVTIKISLNE